MVNKVLQFVTLTFFVLFSLSVGVTAVSTVTCSNGDAYVDYNRTINGVELIGSEIVECGDLDCVDYLGCVDPRDTPGEMFLGMILIFVLGGFTFAYLSMKITSKKHFPIRMIFFFLSLLLVLSGSLMSYFVAVILGHSALAGPALAGSMGILITFLMILFLQLKEFIVWIKESIDRAKRADMRGEDYDGV